MIKKSTIVPIDIWESRAKVEISRTENDLSPLLVCIVDVYVGFWYNDSVLEV